MVRKFKKIPEEYLTFIDDGLIIPKVGIWTLKKLMLVYLYVNMFNNGMKNKYNNRIYIDLFSGCGCGYVDELKKIYKGSPLLAMSLPTNFTKYIFCEQKQDLCDALKIRSDKINVEKIIFEGDYNNNLNKIINEIPLNSLSFCFIDPYDSDFNFTAIERLASNRKIDFMILLATGMDITRNRKQYISTNNARIDLLLGTETWRYEWKQKEYQGNDFSAFVAEYFCNRMYNLGYLKCSKQMVPAINDKNRIIYYLAFFSKDPKGNYFWEQAIKYETDQGDLF